MSKIENVQFWISGINNAVQPAVGRAFEKGRCHKLLQQMQFDLQRIKMNWVSQGLWLSLHIRLMQAGQTELLHKKVVVLCLVFEIEKSFRIAVLK